MERFFKGFLKLLQAEFILYAVLAVLGVTVYLIQTFLA
jgi:hypothetical protein